MEPSAIDVGCMGVDTLSHSSTGRTSDFGSEGSRFESWWDNYPRSSVLHGKAEDLFLITPSLIGCLSFPPYQHRSG